MATLTDPRNATRSTPNIPVEEAVLHLGSSIFIAAPPSKVWAVLTDTSTWPKWNSYIPNVTIRSQPTPDPSASTSAAVLEPTTHSPILQKGTKFIFHLRIDATSLSSEPEPTKPIDGFVSEAFLPNPETGFGRIVWGVDPSAPGAYSPSMITVEREHEVIGIEGGTVVRNWEVLVGWLAWVVKWMYSEKMQAGLDLWVADLKRFCEEDSVLVGSI